MSAKLLSRQRRTERGIDAASLVLLLALVVIASLKFMPAATGADLDLPTFYGSGRTLVR